MGDLPDSAPAGVERHEPQIVASLPEPPPVVPTKPTTTDTHDAAVPPAQPTGQQAFASQLDMTAPTQAQAIHPHPYNMASMNAAIPQVQYRPGQYPVVNQQHRYSHPSPTHMMPQTQYMSHYVPSSGMNMGGGQGYYVQHQQQPNQFYGTNQLAPTQTRSPPQIPRQNMNYYTNHMMNQPQPGYYYVQQTQYPPQNQGMTVPTMTRQLHHAGPITTVDSQHASNPSYDAHNTKQVTEPTQELKDRQQSTVRGPPRKPRQSGHAIWIGNLPPQTNLMSLVHHVCKEASGLDSLFLISKSNCAFANFKDEKSCVQAQKKLHESKFLTVKLVSRLRKDANESVSVAASPSDLATPTTAASPTGTGGGDTSSSGWGSDISGPIPAVANQAHRISENAARDPSSQRDKFFILKSLTEEDLELSVKTGIWATQSHNEETLTNAFKTAETVYLVFSANKSGEYFGYARMLSQIDEDPAAAIEFAPKAQPVSDMDLPKAIVTEATEFAPRGRIIDDSARGTIFWEVDREDVENTTSENESETGSTKSAGGTAEEESKTWGKPFKLEWLSTSRLPFYRTRGLRNPWNANREVKIARDGTEIEPSVGQKLIGLFNKPPAQPQFPAYGRTPIGMAPGYQPRRFGP